MGDVVNFRDSEQDKILNEAKSKQFIKKRKHHHHPNLKQMKNVAKLKIHAEKCEACRVEYKLMKSELLPPLPKNIHCSYNFDLIQGQILEIKTLIASRSEESWKRALDKLEHHISLYPHADLYYLQGTCLSKLSKEKEAVKSLLKCLQFDSYCDGVVEELVHCYWKLRDWKKCTTVAEGWIINNLDRLSTVNHTP